MRLLLESRFASHDFNVTTNLDSSSDAGGKIREELAGNERYCSGSAGFVAAAISAAKRPAILLSPSRSAIFLPSFRASRARGISPLPRKTPALRKMRA